MFLHKNKELFEEVIFNTADFCKLPIAIIEKDYYVTLILKEIAKRNPDIVFKGGTSLSKCYKIIVKLILDAKCGANLSKIMVKINYICAN